MNYYIIVYDLIQFRLHFKLIALALTSVESLQQSVYKASISSCLKISCDKVLPVPRFQTHESSIFTCVSFTIIINLLKHTLQ